MKDWDRPCEVLFINPPSPDGYIYIRDIHRSGRRSRERTLWPQTSLAYLAAIARDLGYTPNVLDCIGADISWKEVEAYIKQRQPKWMVVEGISSTITNDVYASYLGKRYGSKTVLVGPHLTALPEKTMEAYPTLDYGIRGEIELTMSELLKTVDKGEGSLESIDGLVFRKCDKIVVNPERAFIQDLDSLPIPMHELLPIKKYNRPYIGGPYTFVLHSRGCPAACHFCRQNVMWKSKCRVRSGDSIAKEFRRVSELGVKKVVFHSDAFTQDRDNVVDICNKLIAQGNQIEWMCNSRVNLVDEDLLALMRKAGCWMISYGVESGVQELLDAVDKQITVAQTKAAIEMTDRADIKPIADLILGLPGETKETIRQTSKFVRSLPLYIIQYAIATPYPGTPFFKLAKKNGWLKDVSWEDFDQNYSATISYPQLSDKEMLKELKRIHLEWYLTRRGLKTLLDGMTSFENFKTIAKIGIDYLLK
ncbi:MAG: radical SAM protein [Pseudodesulfovibrio sp.]